jgi:hypothetical protein
MDNFNLGSMQGWGQQEDITDNRKRLSDALMQQQQKQQPQGGGVKFNQILGGALMGAGAGGGSGMGGILGGAIGGLAPVAFDYAKKQGWF